ncbi:MAG: hypothetical protein RQ899_13405 [Pseudomonadales bacterium]|nr:hypothetical protein [Pseudomonadales bacterium]
MKKVSVVLLVFAALSVSTLASAQNCNRACLGKHLDAYLNAVVNNQPETGGLFIGFRQTENSVVIPEGEGVWASVTGLGSTQRRYFDSANATAGYFGTISESGTEAVAAIRVKVARGEVTEAEWIISRESDPGINGEGHTPFSLQTLAETLPVERNVPRKDRLSREALVAITNTYFDGITSKNDNIVKGHPGCSRYENGFPTFGAPLREGHLGIEGKTDCRTQGDFGVAIVALRDYFLVDEQAQIVMVNAVFRRDPQNPKRRNHFIELFHIDDAKIRSVHASFYYAPPELPVPNWPPYDGLFPLPAQY